MINREIINLLNEKKELPEPLWVKLLETFDESDMQYAAEIAQKTVFEIYGREVFLRGLIEVSSFCKNDCYYCGLRRGNKLAARYRLSADDIYLSAKEGYGAGLRTFVLQGGEDPAIDCDFVCDVVKNLKHMYPDCAVTLSLGEKDKDEYQKYFSAGADRYLLRHETADCELYNRLHPDEMSLERRKKCLYNLKEIGFQTGAGFMIGVPYQTVRNIAADMIFLKELNPQMVGIGPFIPHKDTPFGTFETGSTDLTVFLISLTRIMLPHSMIPATTALGTSEKGGRERGVLAGANVIMPNISPVEVRKKYLLYDNKIFTEYDAKKTVSDLKKSLESIGYFAGESRGDFK